MAANLDERSGLSALTSAEIQNLRQNQALADAGYSTQIRNVQDILRNRDEVNKKRIRNLGEDRAMLGATYGARLAALQDQIGANRLMNQASLQNQQQRVAAQEDFNRNALAQIGRRKAEALQGLSDQMAIAGDKDKARAAMQQLQLSNITLPSQLQGQAVQDLTSVDTALNNIFAMRTSPLSMANIGAGNMQPVSLPAPKIAVNNTWGNLLSSAGQMGMNYGMQKSNQNFAAKQQEGLMEHQRSMQDDYLNRKYGPQKGSGDKNPWGGYMGMSF